MSTGAETLCRACGLCCDGTLFTFVRLDAGESSRARSRGLAVITREDGTDSLRQPCNALEGRDCRIYADRPGPCATFECMLLIALRAGETTLAEALPIVAEARNARSRSLLETHFIRSPRAPDSAKQ